MLVTQVGVVQQVDVHAMAVRTIHVVSHSQVQSLDVSIFKFRKVFVVTVCFSFIMKLSLASLALMPPY